MEALRRFLGIFLTILVTTSVGCLQMWGYCNVKRPSPAVEPNKPVVPTGIVVYAAPCKLVTCIEDSKGPRLKPSAVAEKQSRFVKSK